VRKLTALVLATSFLAACRSPSPSTSPQPASAGSATGATDARNAVLAFLNAGKNQDLQALSAVWGSAEGSVRDAGVMSREEMEKRELIMMCYLEHDTHSLLSNAPSPNNERVFNVQLRRGALTRSANFYAVAGPAGRWYVRWFDMEALTDFCKNRPRSG
jgi:hypothetical protein